LRILVGYDLSSTGDAALRSVKELMELAPCEVTVLHVYWPPEVRRRLDIHGPVSLVEGDEETQETLGRQLAEKACAVFGADQVTLRVQPGWGRIDADLVAVAREIEADLLVLGSHQRHGLERFRLGSVSRAAISDAPPSV
jgi:nucleotide-binding universal stress UspA family protein